jgi:hypothetical protein
VEGEARQIAIDVCTMVAAKGASNQEPSRGVDWTTATTVASGHRLAQSLATATFLKGLPAIKVGWNLALTSIEEGHGRAGHCRH